MTRSDGHDEVATVGENKKNGREKTGEKYGNKDQGMYCEFHESIGHDTIDCTMLHRELENRMKSRQLTDRIKELRSKYLESIEPVEPMTKGPIKNEIFMFR